MWTQPQCLVRIQAWKAADPSGQAVGAEKFPEISLEPISSTPFQPPPCFLYLLFLPFYSPWFTIPLWVFSFLSSFPFPFSSLMAFSSPLTPFLFFPSSSFFLGLLFLLVFTLSLALLPLPSPLLSFHKHHVLTPRVPSPQLKRQCTKMSKRRTPPLRSSTWCGGRGGSE